MANTATAYRRTLDVLADDNAQGWPLADALHAEIPAGSPHSVYEPIRAAAKAKGLRVPSTSKLRQYRAVGEYWSNTADRVSDPVGRTVGFHPHREAQRKGKVADAKALLEECVAAVGGDAHKVTVNQVKQALGDTLPTKAATGTIGAGTVPVVVADPRTKLEVMADAIGDWIGATLTKGAKTLTDTDLTQVEALVANLTAVVQPEQARRVAKLNRPAPVQVQAKRKHVVKPSAPVVVAGTEAQVEANLAEDAKVEAVMAEAKAKPAPRKRMRG